ncbi:MAG TPA: RNA polymerase sigma factor [Pyrinomonadaceae bacterium]|nr:RNA polymerase sigma factor [Pyrinomonadaceae bacterium]
MYRYLAYRVHFCYKIAAQVLLTPRSHLLDREVQLVVVVLTFVSKSRLPFSSLCGSRLDMSYWPTRRVTAQELSLFLRQAIEGNDGAKEEVFAFLRTRFLSLARYRLPEAAEDVVHDALVVVHRRFMEFDTVDGLLAFTNQVLRNKIGNAYQLRYRRDREALDDEEAGYCIAEQLEGEELDRIMREAIERLRARFPGCGDILSCLLNGLEPTEISTALRIPKSRLKVRTFRCREALRQLLSVEYRLQW